MFAFTLRLLVIFAAVQALTTANPVRARASASARQLPPSSLVSSQLSSDIPHAIGVAKDVTNILFFIVVAVITILTYVKAKRTILQPIRTEVFKQQIGLFTQLLHEFIGKTEIDLLDAAGLDTMLRVNILRVIDQYASDMFFLAIDEEQRPYSTTDCPQTIFNLDPDVMSIVADNDGRTLLTAVRRPWAEFRLAEMKVPVDHIAARTRFASYLESPLLPSRLATLVQEYLNTLDLNVDHIQSAIEEYAHTVSARFPTKESMARVDIGSAQNRFNELRIPLKPIAERIVNFVREYLATDKLLEA